MNPHFIFIVLNKCSGNCNNINAPCARLCVPDLAKIWFKLSNLMSRTNERRHIEWHMYMQMQIRCKCL